MATGSDSRAFWSVVSVFSVVAFSALGYFGGCVAGRRASESGFDKVPVVVVNQDLEPGRTLALDMLAQRLMPEQYVTASIVRPESVSFVAGSKTLAKLYAGDPLTWHSVTAGVTAEECRQACTWVDEAAARKQSDRARYAP